jgi:hypothetical protein
MACERMPVSQLESFLRKASRRSIFVFYDSATEPVKWSRVESIVNNCAIPHVFVLKRMSRVLVEQTTG